MIRAFHVEHGVDHYALPLATDPGGRRRAYRTLIEDRLAGRATRVRESQGRSRQHVFVGDVVDAACAALEAEHLRQRAYNIGPGAMQSLRDVEEQVREAVPGVTVELHPDGLAWNTFGVGALAIDAALRDLGFKPRTSIAEGARQTRLWLEGRRKA